MPSVHPGHVFYNLELLELGSVTRLSAEADSESGKAEHPLQRQGAALADRE